jgi:predicted RNA-binding protein YlqC (UPF0109 family)
MKELLEFIIKKLTATTEVSVSENVNGEVYEYLLSVPKELMGLIIGKNGNTIKAIRNILKIRATLEKKRFYLNVAAIE